MAYDAHKNLAYSTVATAPSPATSGTSLTAATGDGAKFPTPPFNATVWPANSQPTTGNAEIVRVSAIATDTLTIARTQEGTSARSIIAGDQIAASVTAKMFTDLEAAAPNALVTSLPDPPGNGQVIFYQADATNGIVWQFRYNAGSASAYKWEYVGGAALFNAVETDENTTNATYSDLTTVGPVITVPLGGDYEVWTESEMYFALGTGSGTAFMSYQIGATAASDADRIVYINNGTGLVQTITGKRVKTGLATGTALTAKYHAQDSSHPAHFSARRMYVKPIRVG